MSDRSAHFTGVSIVCAVCAVSCIGACGPIEGGASSSATPVQASARGGAVAGGERPFASPNLAPSMATTVVRVNEASERDGGARRAIESAPSVSEWGMDGGVMVSASAGPRSAEIAWLVSHLSEGAENPGPSGPPNVRSLAGYGADGVRAVVPLFRAGDARRVPHARTLIEMLARRACRGTSDVMAPRRLVAWIETGSPAIAANGTNGTNGANGANGANGTTSVSSVGWPWQRGPEVPWTEAGLDRMRAWADRAMFCVPPEFATATSATAVDAGRALLDARAR